MRSRIHEIYESVRFRVQRLLHTPEPAAVRTVVAEDVKEKEILSDFARIVAHDIQSPLATMGIEILTMERRYAGNPQLIDDLGRLERQRHKLAELATMLDLVTRRESFLEERLKRTHVTEVVHAAIREVKSRMNNQKIKFMVSGKEIFATAEPDLLKYVMERTIQNFADVIEATGRQSGVIDVGLRVPPEFRKMVAIEITDSNRALGSKDHFDLRDIFLPDNPRGLHDVRSWFLVQKIIQLHDGLAKVTRAPGTSGATLSILLPRGKDNGRGKEGPDH